MGEFRAAEQRQRLESRRERLNQQRRERDEAELEKFEALTAVLQEVEFHPERSPFSEITEPKKRAFLCGYVLTGSKVRAAEAANISAAVLYTPRWQEDEAFQAAVARARIMSADVLEGEAHRRAVEGVERPVGWYMGEPGGYVREYSDILLMFILKGLLPDRYRERVDVRGVLAHIDLRQLPDEMLGRIADGEHPLAVLAPMLQAGQVPAGALPPPSDDNDA